jgi:hypothetical protein
MSEHIQFLTNQERESVEITQTLYEISQEIGKLQFQLDSLIIARKNLIIRAKSNKLVTQAQIVKLTGMGLSTVKSIWQTS